MTTTDLFESINRKRFDLQSCELRIVKEDMDNLEDHAKKIGSYFGDSPKNGIHKIYGIPVYRRASGRSVIAGMKNGEVVEIEL